MKAGFAIAALLILGACKTVPQQSLTACAAGRGCESRLLALRLKPGDDLRQTLETFADTKALRAGYIATCAGSLRVAAIRFADQKDATILSGPFEIVSLTGTLSPDGPHIHISIADSSGRVFGGHLAEGSVVYTTAEIVVGELAGASFRRALDPATSFRELVVE